MSIHIRVLILLFIFLGNVTGGAAIADEIALKADHPNRYVVVKGDTLWDISARFLETPWRWPEVWSFNPQIKNPHLIYPGDVVSITYDDQGKPILRVERGQATVKLSPKVRSSRIDKPIETVPLNAIQQFLGQPRVVNEADMNNAAYIIAAQDDRLIAGIGDTIYVRGLVSGADKNYTVLRLGSPYRNLGSSNEILGYEAIHVADATVVAFGDPATLKITHSNRETLIGDRLLPRRDEDLDQTFIPHPPDTQIDAQIIAVVDGVSMVGQYQTVVVNYGEQDGIETGHVLAVYQSGEVVIDSLAGSEQVLLPDTKAGIVLVIRDYDRVSYALVMEASRSIKVRDHLRNP
ncbi:MAG: LysM peptidoglycan-binding domain-containing protein [Thiohalomonadales bacterium]